MIGVRITRVRITRGKDPKRPDLWQPIRNFEFYAHPPQLPLHRVQLILGPKRKAFAVEDYLGERAIQCDDLQAGQGGIGRARPVLRHLHAAPPILARTDRSAPGVSRGWDGFPPKGGKPFPLPVRSTIRLACLSGH